MGVVLNEAEPTGRSVTNEGNQSAVGGARNTHSPCVPVQSHDDTLDATTLLGASAFREYLIYLLFGCEEAQVTNLRARVLANVWDVRNGDGYI